MPSEESPLRIRQQILESLPLVGTMAVLFGILFYGGYTLALVSLMHAQDPPVLGLGYYVGFGFGAAFASGMLYASIKLGFVTHL